MPSRPQNVIKTKLYAEDEVLSSNLSRGSIDYPAAP